MFFSRQKEELTSVHTMLVHVMHEIRNLKEDNLALFKAFSKLINIRLSSRAVENEILLNHLKHKTITCEPTINDDNGNMTLEFDIHSVPCKVKHEPLYKDDKLLGMKIKIEWKCVDPC